MELIMAELDSQPKTIQSLYAWYAEDKLFVNRRYQRKLVWTLEEKQKLIESILRKYPVPAILLAERETGGYEIIDGLQRLFAIMSFIENGFGTLDGRIFDVTQFPTAKTRADEGNFDIPCGKTTLSQKEVSTLLDYALAISVMRGSSEDEIDDVFARINTYGHRLSDQERRQAGVQDDFSEMVREVACTLRGDASSDILNLSQMPSISIDLPMTKHGYLVAAENVFWVEQGVLLSTDLRDSMDEQCVADIAACIVGGGLIERSKQALDEIYSGGSTENQRIATALDAYGAQRFSTELKYCIDELLKIVTTENSTKLRSLIFPKRTTNAFPSVFAVIIIALHEMLVQERNKIADYAGAHKALANVAERIDTSRKSTAPDERRKNVNVVKGLLTPTVVEGDVRTLIYDNFTTADIDAALRRSEIELPHYELKQGLLDLSGDRAIEQGLIEKVARTISAIANNGSGRAGTVMIGVADKERDAERIQQLDGVQARPVGRRRVVGVRREADKLGETAEQYFARWKEGIRKSKLEEPLRSAVLSSMNFHDYYGLGLIVIDVPAQGGPSYYDEKLYYRDGDDTVEATAPRQIAAISGRFR
jgi:hypothetical protein